MNVLCELLGTRGRYHLDECPEQESLGRGLLILMDVVASAPEAVSQFAPSLAGLSEGT